MADRGVQRRRPLEPTWRIPSLPDSGETGSERSDVIKQKAEAAKRLCASGSSIDVADPCACSWGGRERPARERWPASNTGQVRTAGGRVELVFAGCWEVIENRSQSHSDCHRIARSGLFRDLA
jgi:hypothetical protein